MRSPVEGEIVGLNPTWPATQYFRSSVEERPSYKWDVVRAIRAGSTTQCVVMQLGRLRGL